MCFATLGEAESVKDHAGSRRRDPLLSLPLFLISAASSQVVSPSASSQFSMTLLSLFSLLYSCTSLSMLDLNLHFFLGGRVRKGGRTLCKGGAAG